MKKPEAKKMYTTTVYILNGTEHEDQETPYAPFQGKTLSTYFKDQDGNWLSMMRNGDGTARLGYLPVEVDEAQASAWKNRIYQAYQSPVSGYLDTAGHWFPGEATNSIITLQAWNKLQLLKKQSYFATSAVKLIDKLADSVMENNHPRGVEYEARFKEAKKFLESGDENSELYQYLAQLQYKGLSLKEAAELVISKYEKANSLDVVISNLRMKKALLKGNLPLSEKEELYDAIVAGLNSAKM